jgi:hypothetical protein
VAEIDCFIASIRAQESGGNYGAYNAGSGAAGAYQFEPGTWRQALGIAGLANWSGTSANQAPAWVQDAAAKALMGSYFNQFGSWYNVAEAWYGGPGAVGHPDWGGGPGYPNVGQYATEVINRMNEICSGAAIPVGGGGPPAGGPPHFDLDAVTRAWAYAQSITNDRQSDFTTQLRKLGQW